MRARGGGGVQFAGCTQSADRPTFSEANMKSQEHGTEQNDGRNSSASKPTSVESLRRAAGGAARALAFFVHCQDVTFHIKVPSKASAYNRGEIARQ